MPDALIVTEAECKKKNGRTDFEKLVRLLVKRGVVTLCRVNRRTRVYGRAYLPHASLRKAFYKQHDKPRRRK